MENKTMNTTQRLTETAIMIALATVLSLIKIDQPMGGSITVCSMLPIIIISYRYGVKWGLFTGITYGLIQMLFGLNNFTYVKTITAYIVVALADYLIAFGVLGLGGIFKNKIKNQGAALALGTFLVCILRFLCHYLSGVTVWSEYAEGYSSVWVYSLVYNGSYMLAECVITIAGAILISLVLDFDKKNLIRKK